MSTNSKKPHTFLFLPLRLLCPQIRRNLMVTAMDQVALEFAPEAFPHGVVIAIAAAAILSSAPAWGSTRHHVRLADCTPHRSDAGGGGEFSRTASLSRNSDWV